MTDPNLPSPDEKSFGNIFSEAYQDIKNICKVTREGVVQFLKPGSERKPASFEAGPDFAAQTARNRQYGTRHKVEGEWVSNPSSHIPSSMFTPAPSVVSSLFAGPMPFLGRASDGQILAIIAVLAAAKGKSKTSYSTVYNNVPITIIDNVSLDTALFPIGGRTDI